MGENYYLCGFYFSRPRSTNSRTRKGRIYLHRAVWKAFNRRPIPKGCHVHHLDEDRSNNHPSNLALMNGTEHLRQHMTPERRAQSSTNIQAAIKAAPAWHRTEEGRAWHRQHARKVADAMPFHTYVCTECGAQFESRTTRKAAPKFCGGTCKMRAFRREHPGYFKRFKKK